MTLILNINKVKIVYLFMCIPIKSRDSFFIMSCHNCPNALKKVGPKYSLELISCCAMSLQRSLKVPKFSLFKFDVDGVVDIFSTNLAKGNLVDVEQYNLKISFWLGNLYRLKVS